MNTDEYQRMRETEDQYWWFVGRRNLAIGLLRRYLEPKAKPEILDLGCGTGVISQEMGQWAEVLSLDMSDHALRFCRERGLTGLVRARGEFLPVKSDAFQAIVALDIFEHIDDHKAAFAQAERVLAPGGLLVLSVPAFQFLWGPHDVALHHFRRYTKRQVDAELKAAGFEVVKLTYSVFFLFPLVVLVRIIEKSKTGEAKASLAPLPKWLNTFLVGVQRFEAALISVVNLPWGSSVVAVARKPKPLKNA
jgi:SAM-dependent methyltransferase